MYFGIEARRELMWVAFQHYVLPILMYGSPIWNPTLQRDINLLESVQRCFTKQITGIKELPYSDRLKSLGALSLRNLRTHADMVTICKSLRNGSAADFGLSLLFQPIQRSRRASEAATRYIACHVIIIQW